MKNIKQILLVPRIYSGYCFSDNRYVIFLKTYVSVWGILLIGGEYLEPVTTIYCVSLKLDNYAGARVNVGLQAFQSNTKILYIVSRGAKYSPLLLISTKKTNFSEGLGN